jgi:serine/threonine protein phosphatase PrpC
VIIEVACSHVPYPNKDEDAFVLREVGDHFILAVADGLSMRNGGAAARWVAEHIKTTTATDCIYALYDNLVDCLRHVAPGQTESETTLSCGILRRGNRPRTLVFEYFAVGDSPIWKVVQSGDDRYPYQRYQVYGSPYPAENAKLYSTVSLQDRSITGAVTFGSVTLLEEEVLVVCSDGLPEREVLVRDLAREKSLCRWLFGKTPYTSQSMQDVLTDYGSRDVFVDDTTVIAARLPQPERQHNEDKQNHAADVSEVPQPDRAPVSEDSTAEVLIAAEEIVPTSIAERTEAPVEATASDAPVQEVNAVIVVPLEQPTEPPKHLESGSQKQIASLLSPPAKSTKAPERKKPHRGKAGRR